MPAATPAISVTSGRRTLSVRALFVMVVTALALLVLALSGLIVFRLVATLESGAQKARDGAAGDISYLIERDIAGVTNVLTVLAASDSLRHGDIEKLYNKSVEVSRQVGFFIVLHHLLRNEQIFNTNFPFQAPIPQHVPFPLGEAGKTALLEGKPAFSDVFFGPRVRSNIVIVCVPVKETDGIRYVLCGNLSLDQFAETLQRARLADDWIVTVFDRKGIILARSKDHNEFSGKPIGSFDLVNPDLPADLVRGSNAEGIPFVWSLRRMEATGWTVGVGVPQRVVDEPMRFGIFGMIGIATAVVLGAMVMAYRFSGPLARPMHELRKAVAAVRREPVPAPPMGPGGASYREISDTLSAATAELMAGAERARFELSAAGVGTWQWDLTTGDEVWSDRYREILGVSGEVKSCLESFLARVHPSDRAEIAEAVMRNISQGAPYDREYRIIRADSRQERWVHAKSRIDRDRLGRPLRVFGVAVDITARKRAELETAASAARLKALVETVSDGVVLIDERGFVLLFNPACERMFGYGSDEVVGRNVGVLMPPPHRDGHDSYISAYRTGNGCGIVGASRELVARRRDGTDFPVLLSVGEVAQDHGSLFIGIVHDLTGYREAQRERDDLRRRLMRAQEDERLRLAQELHDETGQGLAAAMLDLKRLESVVDAPGRKLLDSLRMQLDAMGKSLHRVARELRPTSIDDVGLAKVLADYCTDWKERFGIDVDYQCVNVDLDALPGDVCTVIYRICQEALTNVARHAMGATDVGVIVDRIDNTLRLTIEDNGCGFDESAASWHRGGTPDGGLGLAGMRERLMLIGGELEIESSPGVGTTIFVRIALETAEAPRWPNAYA